MQESIGRRFLNLATGGPVPEPDLDELHALFDINPAKAVSAVYRGVAGRRFDAAEFANEVGFALAGVPTLKPKLLIQGLEVLREAGAEATSSISKVVPLCNYPDKGVRAAAYATVTKLGYEIVDNDQSMLYSTLGRIIPTITDHVKHANDRDLVPALETVVNIGNVAFRKHVEPVINSVAKALPDIEQMTHDQGTGSGSYFASMARQALASVMKDNGYVWPTAAPVPAPA